MSDETTSPPEPAVDPAAELRQLRQEKANLIAYRLAAADLLRATRDLCAAAQRISVCGKAWDPANEREDQAVLGMAFTIEDLLEVAASVPALREAMRKAVANNEPAAPPAAAPERTV